MSVDNIPPSGFLPLPRRSTSTILENLESGSQRSTTNSRWYEPGRDFCFYTAAHEACRESRARLSKLELTADEKMLLAAPRDMAGLEMKLKAIQIEQERAASKKSSLGKKSSDFTNNFCDFATRTSGIVEILLPQSPEYTITYGLLLILFKSVVTKKEREESLTEYLHSLSTQLPMIEFYRTAFPTNAMKLVVANLFVEIMTLLDEALVYYRSGRLSKLTNAILSPSDSKFDGYVKKIEAKAKEMLELGVVAHKAQTADIKEVVDSTGQIVAMLYKNIEHSTTAIGINVELLNERVESLETNVNYILEFETVKYVQQLSEAILPGGWDAEEELDFILHRGFRLSARDHWENNGILDELLKWSAIRTSSLLWVGGQSGNQDTWVTELSADIVQALKPQLLTLLYIFCDSSSKEALTPIRLIKGLIVQLLALHPKLAYQNPSVYTIPRFKKMVTFRQVWRIFEQLASQVPRLFIIIDRIEECEADEQADLKNNLLPSLIDFIDRSDSVSVVVTSIFDPPLELRDSTALQDIYIDTGKRPKKRDK